MPKLAALFPVHAALALALIAGSAHGAALLQPDAAAAPPAAGAGDQDETKKATDAELLADFEHYVFIEQIALAASMGQGLLDRNIEPTAFVKLVDGAGFKRFQDAYVRALRHASLEPVAAKLWTLYQTGKQAMVRSPASVAENIKLLTGSQLARSLARDRLVAASEYAMPQLLQALLQRGDSRLQGEVRQVMVEMGRSAVLPLSTALIDLDPASQQMVAEILGDIGYPTAIPFLYQAMAKTSSAETRRASEDAIRKIAQVVGDRVAVSERFVDLAESYYNESPSLTIFPGETHQLLWSYDPGAGLLMTAIDTPVYHEAMAMRLSETALREDAGNQRAVPLWLAANFSREIDTPATEGFVNPAYGADRRDAMYYAVAAGSGLSQQVLARGLDASDTPLIRRSLAAVDRTAGGKSLWSGQGERKPLLEALRYPSRRVQYEAALALGGAGPREAFDGSDQVVRILGSAIRDASARYALVLTGNSEQGESIAEALRAQGYTVLPRSASLSDAEQAISQVPGVDLIVTYLPGAQTGESIDQALANNRLRATPILALVTVQGFADQANRYVGEPRVKMLRDTAGGQEIAEAGRQLVETATGGDITPEEAEAYKARSLSVLRDLAVSGSTVLNVTDAGGPLISALAAAEDDTKARIAEVLSHVNTGAAQQAVTDAALAAKGEAQVQLLNIAAGSAKRFGNLLEARQVSAIRELATTGEASVATAAAAMLGALSLPNSEMVPLILGSAGTVAGDMAK